MSFVNNIVLVIHYLEKFLTNTISANLTIPDRMKSEIQQLPQVVHFALYCIHRRPALSVEPYLTKHTKEFTKVPR